MWVVKEQNGDLYNGGYIYQEKEDAETVAKKIGGVILEITL